MIESGIKIGLDFQAPLKWEEYLTAAGFVDVHVKWVNWPIGPWAKGEKNKTIGKVTLLDFIAAVDSAVMLLHMVLGWTVEDTQIFTTAAMDELREQKVHLYQRIAFAYGRKPENSEPQQV